MDRKQDVLDVLKKLHTIHKQNKDRFKAIAYGKAVASISTLDGPVTGVDDVKGLPGVGKAIEEKITAVIEGRVGDISQLQISEEAKKDMVAIELFTGVWGVGEARAKDLVKTHRLYTLEGLKGKAATNPDILTKNQHIGLKYYEDIAKRIPRKEMEKHDGEISVRVDGCMEELDLAGTDYHIAIAGSYRRRAKESGDVDVLVSVSNDALSSSAVDGGISKDTILHKIVDCLCRPGYMVEKLTVGKKKFMGIARLKNHRTYRRVDVMVIDEESYPFALLYFTGSQKFNIKMRSRALEMGYSLNEYGLTLDKKNPLVIAGKIEPAPKMRVEKDVFEFLKMEWKEPWDR